MLTMFSHDEAVFASLRAGRARLRAQGCTTRRCLWRLCVRPIKGSRCCPPLLTTRVVDRMAVLTQEHVAADALTVRELEVLQGMAKGLRYKDIAVAAECHNQDRGVPRDEHIPEAPGWQPR